MWRCRGTSLQNIQSFWAKNVFSCQVGADGINQRCRGVHTAYDASAIIRLSRHYAPDLIIVTPGKQILPGIARGGNQRPSHSSAHQPLFFIFGARGGRWQLIFTVHPTMPPHKRFPNYAWRARFQKAKASDLCMKRNHSAGKYYTMYVACKFYCRLLKIENLLTNGFTQHEGMRAAKTFCKHF